MSQINVERVIGALVTDDALRRRFASNPRAALEGLVARGIELTPGERQALAAIDPTHLERCTEWIDARLLKSDLEAARVPGPEPAGATRHDARADGRREPDARPPVEGDPS
jgi:hypothetical protein